MCESDWSKADGDEIAHIPNAGTKWANSSVCKDLYEWHNFFLFKILIYPPYNACRWIQYTNHHQHLHSWSFHCRTKVSACCLQRSQFLALIYQFILPQYCCSSSLYLYHCLPRFILPPMDVQTVNAAAHLLSVLGLMWPARADFSIYKYSL